MICRYRLCWCAGIAGCEENKGFAVDAGELYVVKPSGDRTSNPRNPRHSDTIERA